tara:strand:- start:215 stop:493 length:279 start_codon:yes stop_codon:yes gene_type:complete
VWIKWLLGFSIIFQFRHRKRFGLIKINNIKEYLEKQEKSVSGDESPLYTYNQTNTNRFTTLRQQESEFKNDSGSKSSFTKFEDWNIRETEEM